MAGVNRAMLIGNLGSDPVVRYTPAGTAVARFTLATTAAWIDAQGKRQERTDWHRIVAWKRLAELVGEHLKKGRQVYVSGRMQTREWAEKDGTKRWSTEVVADEVQFLGTATRDEVSEPASMPRDGIEF